MVGTGRGKGSKSICLNNCGGERGSCLHEGAVVSTAGRREKGGDTGAEVSSWRAGARPDGLDQWRHSGRLSMLPATEWCAGYPHDPRNGVSAEPDAAAPIPPQKVNGSTGKGQAPGAATT